MSGITNLEREFAERIFRLRSSRKLQEAVETCNEAIKIYNESNFFYKIKGDILYDLKEYENAINAYMIFLDKIKENPEYFTNFTRFFGKVSNQFEIPNAVFEKIARLIKNIEYPYVIRRGLLTIFLETYPTSKELLEIIEECKQSYVLTKVKNEYERIQSIGQCETIAFLCNLKKDSYLQKDSYVDRFLLKRLEKSRLYEPAILLVKGILGYSNDIVDVRSLFRICRERNDYTEAKIFMKQKDIIHEKEFNIQYELVLFFESEGDEIARNKALEYIDELSENKIPICNTLFKFYIKYNMLEQAENIKNRIAQYNKETKNKKKKLKVTEETEKVIWNRLQALVNEQEHNRQLLAMTELIKGFSHELGQPITNIRYAIQLFNRKNKKMGIEINSEEKILLEGILIQTERVGKLLNRFAPITSSRSQKEYFSVIKVIESIFEEMSSRLLNENIQYKIVGDPEENIYGEILQFSQVFYNLIINAIYAINKKGTRGEIKVEQYIDNNILKITFSDNGIGIKPELQKKIFEPFFSTKKKEIEEGGEGLGLFIVWNILKLFNGRIYVDPFYRKGARFIIEINLEENSNV